MTPKRPPEFDAALVAYMPMLYGLASRFAAPDNREDVVQATLLAAIVNWRSFKGTYARGGGFAAWLRWKFRSTAANIAARKTPDLVYGAAWDYAIDTAAAPATQGAALAARQGLQQLAVFRDGRVLLRRAAGYGLVETGAATGLTINEVRGAEARARRAAAMQEAA